MKEQDQRELAANVIQHKSASMMQAVSIVLGLVGAIWHGFPAILLGLLGAWVFHLAKPGPIERLDRISGRDKPG